jgi:cell division septum initiation protein DivIVA
MTIKNKYPTYKELYKENEEQKNQIEKLECKLKELKEVMNKINSEASFQNYNYYGNIPEFSLIARMAERYS